MGDFCTIRGSRSAADRGRIGLVALALSVGLGAALAPVAQAEEPTPATGPTAVASSDLAADAEAGGPVSTSPRAALTDRDSSVQRGAAGGPSPLPLTRAATQLRVEQMSPVEWLSRFGSIEVGQID